ncbi:hypothetical protein [Myroides odoratimimus]|uniref:hypothetical protein n=1 Tax=Myroides odoratimimus TaxID=76832 RepID=UPI002576DD2F|nr:hypothetical protein [Myroides odoratimimus]MDM1325924.1 hypothetical protein [Myroides odoratimimus]
MGKKNLDRAIERKYNEVFEAYKKNRITTTEDYGPYESLMERLSTFTSFTESKEYEEILHHFIKDTEKDHEDNYYIKNKIAEITFNLIPQLYS